MRRLVGAYWLGRVGNVGRRVGILKSAVSRGCTRCPGMRGAGSWLGGVREAIRGGRILDIVCACIGDIRSRGSCSGGMRKGGGVGCIAGGAFVGREVAVVAHGDGLAL